MVYDPHLNDLRPKLQAIYDEIKLLGGNNYNFELMWDHLDNNLAECEDFTFKLQKTVESCLKAAILDRSDTITKIVSYLVNAFDRQDLMKHIMI